MKKEKKKEKKPLLTVGRNLFIRTVTNFYTGKVISFTKNEITLDKAAWIADTERWADSLATGMLNEIEPYPDGPVVVNRCAFIDYCEWKHELPRIQK